MELFVKYNVRELLHLRKELEKSSFNFYYSIGYNVDRKISPYNGIHVLFALINLRLQKKIICFYVLGCTAFKKLISFAS